MDSWDGIAEVVGPKVGRQSRTNLIPYQVKVYNIEDIEGFINTCADRYKQLRCLDGDERDELISEGIAILIDLARRYQPKMDGYKKEGTFSGYCGAFLPLKMLAAWYKMHPEHLQQTVRQEDGSSKREWQHGDRPWSLDSLQGSMEGNESGGTGHSQTYEEVIGNVRVTGDFVR